MQKSLRLKLLVLLSCFLLKFNLQAQSEQTYKHRISALKIENNAIKLDGILDEDVWKMAEALTEFTQRTPYYEKPATEKTLVKILYDDNHLYVGAVCYYKDMSDLVANKLIHRDVSDDDLFAFVVDTFHDKTKGYCFEVNALGAKEDLFIDGPDQLEINWNEVWHVKTKINEDNWSVEFKIPSRILRFPNKNNQTWGFNICRILRKKNETIYWAPIPPQFTLSNLSLAGDLINLQGLKSKRNLQVRPYTLLGISKDAEMASQTRKSDLGFDLKYVPKPNLAVDFTLRPDFAQIESDDEQINLSRFSLYYPEKRDFFLENAQLFEFGLTRRIQPFFPRSIGIHNGEPVSILYGARMTGKFARTNIGLMNARTEKEAELPTTHYIVLRLRQDILENSNIGFILTNVQSSQGYNRCWGIDTLLWLSKNSRVKAFYSGVDSEETKNQRSAWHISYWWNTDLRELFLSYNDIEKNYSPASGFVIINNVRDYSGIIRKSFRPDKHGIRKVNFSYTFDFIYTQENSNFFKVNMAEFSTEFDSGDTVALSLTNTYEKLYENFYIYNNIFLPPGSFSYTNASLNVESDRKRRISGSFLLTLGEFYDGKIKSFAAEGLWKLNKHVFIGGGLEGNDIHLPEGNFDTIIGRFRLNLILSSSLSIKTYLQYNSARDRIIMDIRLSLLHGKDNELYLVYSNLSSMEFNHFRSVRDTTALKLNYRLYL